MANRLKILMISSEVHPFAKTGGLADVSAALPKALKAMGHDIRVVMPGYQAVDRRRHNVKTLETQLDIPLGGVRKKGTVEEARLHPDVPVYFIGNDEYFRQRKGLYGESDREYPDNAARFIFFCRAALETCRALEFQPDIIHCHDWQTSLIPVYLKSIYREDPFFRNARTVLTVHNLAFQGIFERSNMDLAGLPGDLFTSSGVEFFGKLGFLKAGLVYADALTTVSPSYSREIQTEELGFGLEGIFRQRANDLHGILNAVDYQEWDPARDPWIKKKYSPESLDGKWICKQALARKFSITAKRNVPILSIISRLSQQKGMELVIDGMDEMMRWNVCFTIIGTGHSEYEDFFRELPKRYPGKCASYIGFDDKLAHQILAGSDMLLVPSKFEPCGLTQMYALKYGTVPLVRAAGGLEDTIDEFDPRAGAGTGFKFSPFETKIFLQTAQKALSLYKDRKRWRQLMLNGMARDFNWSAAAEKYARLYAALRTGSKSSNA